MCHSHPRGSPVKPQLSLKWLREPSEVEQEDANALSLKFSEVGCASSRLVGGKGCQLALLTQLLSDVRLHFTCFYLTSSLLQVVLCCVSLTKYYLILQFVSSVVSSPVCKKKFTTKTLPLLPSLKRIW